MSDDSPTLLQALEAFIAAQLADMRVCDVGRVEKFDADKLLADVKILIKDVYYDEAGNRIERSVAIITDVPVCLPGAGSVSLRFDVPIGSTVLLVFAHRNISRWKATGREVAPDDDRRNHLGDAFAIPMQNRPSPANHSPCIEVTDSEVKAGGDASLALKAELVDIKARVAAAAATAAGIQAAFAAWPVNGTQVTKGS